MEGSVEKQSAVLGRNAVFSLKSRVDRLPRVLCVQFMRFYFKRTPDSRDHEGVKCKMLRPVTFPMTLDTFEFCSEGTILWGMAEELQIDVDALRGFQRWINVRRHWRRLSFYGLVKALAEHRRQRRADLVLWLVLYYWHP